MLEKFKELIPNMKEVKDDPADFYEYLVKNTEIIRKVNIGFKYRVVKDFCDKFTIKYLNSVLDSSYKGSIEDLYKEYEIMSVLTCGAALLSVEIEDDDFTEDNYDSFKNSGLDNYLYMATGGSFVNMLTLCDRLSGINNLSIMAQLNEVFARNPSLDEFNEAMANMDTILGKKEIAENLKFVKDFERFNDPNLAKLVDSMSKIEETQK